MTGLQANETRLLPGLFKEREKLNRKYLLELDNRALLQSFYMEAGLELPELQVVDDPVKCYLHWGWEAPTCPLRGHFLGHYLSACARLSAGGQDYEIHGKLLTLIDELERCQMLNGGEWVGSIPEKFFRKLESGDHIWSPQYTVHKTLMGLLDAYEFAGVEKALQILDRASEWYLRWAKHLSEVGKEAVILKGEAGGMLEIWARLYRLTGAEKYLYLANCYSGYRNLEALRAGEDALTDNHANASVPEAHGACMMYEATGDAMWLETAKLFWKNAYLDREHYASGGQNAGEFWIPPHHFYEALGDRDQEFCTMYNMVRLADYLYRFTGEVTYLDYIERALYNAFLAQQNKLTGMPTYFLPQRAGARKKWGTKRNDFWCCYGTMVQAQTLYPALCYYKDEAEQVLTVAQYIPSICHTDMNGHAVEISQDMDMTYCAGALFGEENSSQKSRFMLRVTIKSEEEITVKFRIPDWAHGSFVLNGEEKLAENGWYECSHVSDAEFHLYFQAELTTEPLTDGPGVTAILAGPVVLATVGEAGANFGLHGKKPEEVLYPFVEHTYESYPWQQSTYRAYAGEREVTFLPLYEVTDEMYTLYVKE